MLWNKHKTNIDNDKRQNTTSRDIGQFTEHIAAEYLSSQGLTLHAKNFHCRGGEIDLIMREGSTYVFVEVKYRKSKHFGGAIAAISPVKQKKIKHCVTFFLHQAGLNEYNTPCRMDVIALEGELAKPEVIWIKNAF